MLIHDSRNLRQRGVKHELKKKKKNPKVVTFSVTEGSPEKSSLVFEIARFVAGSITLARRKMSSSLSLKSCFFSSLFLQFIYTSANIGDYIKT